MTHIDRIRALGLTVTRFARLVGYHHLSVRRWGKMAHRRGTQPIPPAVALVLDAWEKHHDLIPQKDNEEDSG